MIYFNLKVIAALGVMKKSFLDLYLQKHIEKSLKMKNKDFDSFNNDRINALRKRIDELIFLKNSWEKQGKSTKSSD